MAVEVVRPFLKLIFAAATLAALLLPSSALAQDQRRGDEWLIVSPTDPRAGIERSDRSGGAPSLRRYPSRSDSVAGHHAYEASRRDRSLRILVSLEERTLWVVAGVDTVLEAPIAIGSGQSLEFGDRSWHFYTPRGIRTVRGKDADPHWTPPDWHYVETAKEYGLKLSRLSLTRTHPISEGRRIAFRNAEAGVIFPDGSFAFLPLDEEIVFDSTLFIPPVGSRNRQIQGELGKYKLDTGGGILLHGTPHRSSIGKAATHGCLRLRDEDIEWLYEYVPVGTRVYIY